MSDEVVAMIAGVSAMAAVVLVVWLALRDGRSSAKKSPLVEGWTAPPDEMVIHISHHAVWLVGLGTNRHVTCIDCDACSCHHLGMLALPCESLETE